MNAKEFAEKYRVRLNERKHERKFGLSTSEDTIHGRHGEIVSDASYVAFAVRFVATPRSASVPGTLRNRFKAAVAGGLILKQRYGSDESTFHFNPENQEHSRLALKLVGARNRRTVNMTPEQRQAVADRLRLARQAPQVPFLENLHSRKGIPASQMTPQVPFHTQPAA